MAVSAGLAFVVWKSGFVLIFRKPCEALSLPCVSPELFENDTLYRNSSHVLGLVMCPMQLWRMGDGAGDAAWTAAAAS